MDGTAIEFRRIRDVAWVRDGSPPQQNIVRANKEPAVLGREKEERPSVQRHFRRVALDDEIRAGGVFDLSGGHSRPALA